MMVSARVPCNVSHGAGMNGAARFGYCAWIFAMRVISA